jgi:hypothetical protein
VPVGEAPPATALRGDTWEEAGVTPTPSAPPQPKFTVKDLVLNFRKVADGDRSTATFGFNVPAPAAGQVATRVVVD